MSVIVELATRQLAAYNAADLDGFCGCYHSDVVVFDGSRETLRGLDAFRERYRGMFEAWTFGASVEERLSVGPHAVDDETWWRVDPETGERSEGEVLVRYTERDGLIGTVQFLR
jgi:hypothetical protein